MDALDLLVFIGAVMRELAATFGCHIRLMWRG